MIKEKRHEQQTKNSVSMKHFLASPEATPTTMSNQK